MRFFRFPSKKENSDTKTNENGISTKTTESQKSIPIKDICKIVEEKTENLYLPKTKKLNETHKMTEDTQQGEVLTGGERTRDPYRLYVSNLPYETDIDMLKKKFSKFCVSEVELKRNGYGFVSFEDQENAKKAMNECNGTEYEGRKIKVDIAYRKLTNDEYAELGSSPKRNLYVSQLAESTDEETLRSVFEKFGELEDVSVFSTQKGGHFAFVKFANLSDADKARQNISKIAETDVKIQFAQSKGPRRGRGVFRGGNRGMRGGSNNITHEKRRLYISGLDSSTTEEILEQNFSPYGSIENVNIIREEESNRPRGFAFVTFSTVEEADLALDSLKGVKICNNEITVEKARVSTRGRGRGRGGFQGRNRGGFRGRGRGRGGSRGRVRKGFGQSRGGSRSENQPASTESEKPQSENVVSFEAEAQNWGSGNDVPTWGDESAQ